MSPAPGRCRWALSAGHVPSAGCGPEPAFTSRDQLAVLNAGDAPAAVRIALCYARRAEIGPFRLTVAPRRLRVVRLNDLIFPIAVRLDEDYGLEIESDVPVVVQFTRQDTRAAALAAGMSLAYAER